MRPQFSIITPSFRSGRWLPLCLASVADQGVNVEHIVQDAGSDDGTLDWLSGDPRAKVFVEKDAGMYDGINRGLRRAQGEILAYLNCDEQYLPGALEAVGTFFNRHPEVDVVFADTVVVDSNGRYLCQRGALIPTRYHSLVSFNLAILTCSTFFRRRLITEKQVYFDARYRDLGDAHWVLSLLERKIPTAVFRCFTTAFTDTGENMNLKPNAQREKQVLFASAPLWARKLRLAIVAHYRLRKLLTGLYFQKPFSYSIYTAESPAQRREFAVANPTARWHRP